MGRRINVRRNILYESQSKIISYLLIFVVRTVFVRYVAVEVLGINSIFTNLTLLFSIAESGLCSAFESLLYEPIRKADKRTIAYLLQKLRKEFFKVSLIVIGMSIVMYPFLGWISSDIYIKNFWIIYIMFAVKSALCYLCSAEETLLSAMQKKYILSRTYQYAVVVRSVMQIVILIVTKSFVLYMAVQFLTDLLAHYSNVLICRKANQYLSEYKNEKLQYDEKIITERIRAGFLNHIAYVIMNGTDSIVITKIVGLYVSGLYSNYLMIVQVLNAFETIIYNSITASIGDLIVEKNVENTRKIFDRILLLGTIMSGFISICFYILANPFISFWIGDSYILSERIVFLISLVMFVGEYGYRKIILIFKLTSGNFTKDKWWALLEGVSNAVLSIILGMKMGIEGVLLATIIASVILPITSLVIVSRNVIMCNPAQMAWKLMLYFLRLIVVTVIMKLATMNFRIESIASLFVMFLAVPFMVACLIHILFIKNENYNYYFQIIKQKILSYRIKR